MRARELKVVSFPGPAKHDTVEPIMVFEAEKLLQTEPLFVKMHYRIKIVGGPSDAKYG
jgi:hypothetical protein